MNPRIPAVVLILSGLIALCTPQSDAPDITRFQGTSSTLTPLQGTAGGPTIATAGVTSQLTEIVDEGNSTLRSSFRWSITNNGSTLEDRFETDRYFLYGLGNFTTTSEGVLVVFATATLENAMTSANLSTFKPSPMPSAMPSPMSSPMSSPMASPMSSPMASPSLASSPSAISASASPMPMQLPASSPSTPSTTSNASVAIAGWFVFAGRRETGETEYKSTLYMLDEIAANSSRSELRVPVFLYDFTIGETYTFMHCLGPFPANTTISIFAGIQTSVASAVQNAKADVDSEIRWKIGEGGIIPRQELECPAEGEVGYY